MLLSILRLILLAVSKCKATDNIGTANLLADVASSSGTTPQIESGPNQLGHLEMQAPLHTSRPWYHIYVKGEKQMLQELNRLHFQIPMSADAYAEASDDMEVGNLTPKQVTTALIRIAKRSGEHNRYFAPSFRRYRKLILDTQAEMRILEADDSQASASLMEGVTKIIHEAFGEDILDTWPTEELAIQTMQVIGRGHTKSMWDHALYLIMAKKRGVKEAAYFKRRRLHFLNTGDGRTIRHKFPPP